MTSHRVWIEHTWEGEREWTGGPPCSYCDLGYDDGDCTCFEDTDTEAAIRIKAGTGYWKAARDA